MAAPVVVADELVSVWRQQRVWSRTADRLRRRIQISRYVVLGLTIAAAVLATASVEITEADTGIRRWLAALTATALAALPLAGYGSGMVSLASWTRARSVSEALKTEVYQFLAGVTPYRGPERGALLLARVEQVERDAADLRRRTRPDTGPPRPLPAVHDVDSYVRVRVTAQVDRYYRRKARSMRRMVLLLRGLEWTLAIAAAVAVGLTTVLNDDTRFAPWIGVVTTVAAVLIAHRIAGRYEYQAVEFAGTADELERLVADRADDADQNEATDDAFVAACEQVISIENETWMIKLNADPEV